MNAAKTRAAWLKQLHRWHWVSAAVSLVAMLAFAVTGITLNHAADIEASPQVETRTALLPGSLLAMLAPAGSATALPVAVTTWLDDALDVDVGDRAAEWSPDEIYLALPRPGGDAWLTIDRASGDIEYEVTDRGLVAWLNDLHKGRNTSRLWNAFIDVFSVACIVFCLTGLVLLQLHGKHRPATWPLVGAGAALPLLIALFLMH